MMAGHISSKDHRLHLRLAGAKHELELPPDHNREEENFPPIDKPDRPHGLK